MATDWIATSYGLVIVTLAAVALYALAYPKFIAAKYFSKEGTALDDLEGFLTARKSQNRWRIAFSFYAGSVGAWAITTPANYATFAGWVGMSFYALACGVPIIVLAYFGDMVRSKYPTAGALGDVILTRFGPAMRYCTCVVALFNMAIFMLAEFTTIGALFQDFVGSIAYPIIIVMAVLTTAYSAYGGLLVSIVTDQIQAGVSMLFLAVLCIYVMATFKQPLVPGFGDLAPLLGPNESGYGAIFVMPVSLMAATVFNEGMWQRVWAAEDQKALQQGGIMGCIAVVVAIFLYGFLGFIAAWGGLIDFEQTNINLYLFQVFKTNPEDPPNSVVDSAIEVVTLMLALVMSESAIDSLQNGIAATISSTFLRGKRIVWARAIVVLINVLIVPFALANYNVLSLFLSANMLGCCWFVPILVGGVWDSPVGRRVISETTTILGACAAILLVSLYGISDGPKQCASMAAVRNFQICMPKGQLESFEVRLSDREERGKMLQAHALMSAMHQVGALWPPFPDVCHCASPEELGDLVLEKLDYTVNCGSAGVQWAWVKHPYMWQHFVLITFCSPLFVAVFGLINLQLPETNPGISDLLGLAYQRSAQTAADQVEQIAPKQVKETEMQAQVPPMMMAIGQPAFDPMFAYRPGAPGMMPPVQIMPGQPVGGMMMMPAYPVPAHGMHYGWA